MREREELVLFIIFTHKRNLNWIARGKGAQLLLLLQLALSFSWLISFGCELIISYNAEERRPALAPIIRAADRG